MLDKGNQMNITYETNSISETFHKLTHFFVKELKILLTKNIYLLGYF